jgi:predicted transposase/invertase (TIGR01784 family)
MAGEILMSVSKDERERAVFRSRRMYQTDLESNLATAEERGRREGEARGRQEGREEGRQEGMIAVAKNLLSINMPADQIVSITGLSITDVEKLRLGEKR